MSRTRLALTGTLTLVALLALSACPDPDPEHHAGLYALTGAPPALTARLDANEYDDAIPDTVTLTQGVGLAVSTWCTCEDYCVGATLTAQDPEMIDVRHAYLPRNGDNAFVIIGLKKGITRLALSTSCAATVYTATVEAPPEQ